LRSVFFYISGHGFGHASRQIEVLNALGGAAPDLQLVVRTAAARWLFDRTVRVPIVFLPAECDTGVVQIDSLHLDERATIEQAAAFYATLETRAAAEAALLRERQAAFVVSDAPPLGCAAAVLAGVPSVVVANFTWDWIYEAYTEHLRRVPDLLVTIHAAYRATGEAWRLPMHGGFDPFDSIIDLPFIARHARHEPEAVRRALKLPADRRLALVSFGGFGVKGVDIRAVDSLPDVDVILTHGSAGTPMDSVPPNVHLVSESVLYDRGFRYEDLVRAVDVVISKPGYGIISECIANDTALVYTSRGRFAEYDVLVAEMPRYLRCAYIDQAALLAGRWRDAVASALSAPAPAERPATDGARVVADLIGARLASGSGGCTRDGSPP
jgi:L-arabinokinase